LMDKYRLSLQQLQNIFLRLLDAREVNRSDLEPLLSIPHVRLDVGKRRESFRNCAFVKLPLFDLDNLLVDGTIVDISENGFQSAGISATLGDTKKFLIEPEYFADVFPFVLQARCRWVATRDEGQCVAGFEITDISEQGLIEIRKISSILTIHA
jgi:hypothetical protein